MKLVGHARIYWNNIVERQAILGRQEWTWADMSETLKNKYCPRQHQKVLHSKLLTLRQGLMTVTEYLNTFEDLIARTRCNESDWQLANRFITGLRMEIRHEVELHDAQNLDDAFHYALLIEKQKKTANFARFKTTSNVDQTKHPNRKTPLLPTPTTAKPNSYPKPIAPITRDPTCFHCQKKGHIASQCPSKIGIIEESDPIDNEDEEPENDMEDYLDDSQFDINLEYPDNTMSVMRCLSVGQPTVEDWRRKNIFSTGILLNNVKCKLVIDGGSAMNVISTATLTHASLTTEPHPDPFHVSWVNHTSLPVTTRCLVPIKIGSYEASIWCDVLPMDIAHILLGRPWLYDMDVIHYGRENTYVFKFKNKTIKLFPTKPLDKPSPQSPGQKSIDYRPISQSKKKAHLQLIVLGPISPLYLLFYL